MEHEFEQEFRMLGLKIAYYCKSQYKNAQKSEYKNVQGSDIYSSGCASKKDRFSLRRYDGPLIETISE